MANDFNFARKPFTNERLPRLIFASVAMVVLGTTLLHGFTLAGYLLREREELDDQVAETEREIAEANAAIAQAQSTLTQERNEIREQRTRFLTRLYRQKSFSWTGLFEELEEIMPGQVRVTSITPGEEDGNIVVTMTLVGRQLTNILETVRELEGSGLFGKAFPLEEAYEEETGEIVVVLQLLYAEAVPESEQPASSLVTSNPAEATTAEAEPETEPTPSASPENTAKESESPTDEAAEEEGLGGDEGLDEVMDPDGMPEGLDDEELSEEELEEILEELADDEEPPPPPMTTNGESR